MNRMLLAALCGLFLFVPAQARWSPKYANAAPEVKEWFKSQHNAQGQWCCDESDGHPYYGAYTPNADGSITVELDGKPHVIPKHMVLTGPNPTGHAVWWYLDGTVYGHIDYCFSPGPMG